MSTVASGCGGGGGGGETNFSNEEIDNCVNIVEESAAGSSSHVDFGMDKSAEKNIYYNDMKAVANGAGRGFYADEEHSYTEDDDGELVNGVGADDDDNEEVDDDDEDEDDESAHFSPLVRVKYNCEYDYDNQKFHLIEGETLFLINKSNQDWWLCLRLTEKLTFFVPATYVKEIESGSASTRLQPPPRPPPPPPPAPMSRASASQTSTDVGVPSPRPQVKKRRQPQQQQQTDSGSQMTTSRVNMEAVQSVYENLADSGSGPSRLAENADDAEYGLSPDAIISDLDDRLNREEESFVNRTDTVTNVSSSGTSATGGDVDRRQSRDVFGVNDSVSKVLLPSASIDPDYVHTSFFA